MAIFLPNEPEANKKPNQIVLLIVRTESLPMCEDQL